jgi:hypothetical protein
MSNYIQPGTANPVTPVDSSGHPLGTITVQIEGANQANPLVVTAAVAKYIQGGTAAPAAPVAGQLDGTALGRSKHVFADGRSVST